MMAIIRVNSRILLSEIFILRSEIFQCYQTKVIYTIRSRLRWAQQGAEGDRVGHGEEVRVVDEGGERLRPGGGCVLGEVGPQVGMGGSPGPGRSRPGTVPSSASVMAFSVRARCCCHASADVGAELLELGSPRRWAASRSWNGRYTDRCPGPRSSTT